MTYKYFLFESTHQVMKADKLLTAAACVFDIIPTPKQFSSDCGLAVRIDKDASSFDTIKELLQSEGMIFRVEEG